MALRRFPLVWVALLFVAALVHPGPAAHAAQPRDFAVPNGHFYTQANGQGGAGGTGFTIADDGGIPFWTDFQQLGGVTALGYPISGRFLWDGFIVQATQKVVLQWHPDTGQVEFLNLYDLMHQLKQDPWLQAYRGLPPLADWSGDTGLTWDQVKARHLLLLDANPAIKAAYNAAPGDPVTLYGLPMAPISPNNAASPSYYVLRCQRVTIQQWVVDAPASGAHAGDIDITNAGDEAKVVGGTGIYPANAPLTPALPGQPNGPLVTAAATGTPAVVATATPAAVPTVTSSAGGIAPGLRYTFAVHMYNGNEQPVINAVKNAGFGWIKQQVEWKTIESSPGSFDYGELDTIVNSAHNAGLNIVLSIVQAPMWARVAPDAPYPRNPADLAAFFTNMVTRYRGKVQAYEVWNEENFAREVGPNNINPGNFVELLHASHDAIKAADPSAIVISGAPTPTGVNDPTIAMDDTTYLQQMYAYQGGVVKNYFDVLGAHAEAWANPPEENVANHTQPNYSTDKSFFFRHLEDYRALMVANGDGNKQIWETEFGYDSCQGANIPAPPGYGYCKQISEQMQADYLVRAFNYAKQNYPWLGMIAVWNLNFQALVPPSDEKWGWGVLRADYSPRPAYTALQQMPK